MSLKWLLKAQILYFKPMEQIAHEKNVNLLIKTTSSHYARNKNFQSASYIWKCMKICMILLDPNWILT